MKQRKQWSENLLWQALLPIIKQGAKKHEAGVKRAFQPTAQADTKKPTVFLHRVGTQTIGAQGKIDEVSKDKKSLFTHEVTVKETTFMLYARVPASSSESTLTGTDLLDTVLGFIYSDEGLYALKKEGLGILAKQPAQEVTTENAEGHFEITYSAQIIVCYAHTITREVPYISTITHAAHRV